MTKSENFLLKFYAACYSFVFRHEWVPDWTVRTVGNRYDRTIVRVARRIAMTQSATAENVIPLPGKKISPMNSTEDVTHAMESVRTLTAAELARHLRMLIADPSGMSRVERTALLNEAADRIDGTTAV